MPSKKRESDSESSAEGFDFDDVIRDRAANLGSTLAENGVDALMEEVENMLPAQWRSQIQSFPITAVLLGVGVGLFLGMRKGDELVAAGTTLLTAAATTNLNSVFARGAEDEA